MHLNVSEANCFWDIYEHYELQRERLDSERLKIVNDYIAAYQRLDEKSADKIVTRCLENDQEMETLHQKYNKIVKKNVSALKAAQFMQIEIYLHNVVRIQLQNQLLFIGEIILIFDKEELKTVPFTHRKQEVHFRFLECFRKLNLKILFYF